MRRKPLSALPLSFNILLFFSFAAQAQQTLPPAAEPISRPLKIFVLQGNNALNSIPTKRAIAPVVEVRDQNERPVEGADVTFELPAAGPGGTFAQDRKKETVRTNVQGQATVLFNPNQEPGSFEIKVTAQAGNSMGATTIEQTNTLDLLEPQMTGIVRKPVSKWKLLAIGGGVAAAVVGILIAVRGPSGDSSSAPTIIITPGGPVFGGTR